MFNRERILSYWADRVPIDIARLQTIWERNRAIVKMVNVTGCTIGEAANFFGVHYQTALIAIHRGHRTSPVSKFLAINSGCTMGLEIRNKAERKEQKLEKQRRQRLEMPGELAWRLWMHSRIHPTPAQLAALGRERFLRLPHCGHAMLALANKWLALHNLEMGP